MINLHGNYLSFCLLCPTDYEKYFILQEKSRIFSLVWVYSNLFLWREAKGKIRRYWEFIIENLSHLVCEGEGGREAAAEGNICPGGGARVPSPYCDIRSCRSPRNIITHVMSTSPPPCHNFILSWNNILPCHTNLGQYLSPEQFSPSTRPEWIFWHS